MLLGATTSFPDVLHGLERLRTPRLLTLIAALHVPLPVRDRRRGAAHARLRSRRARTARATLGQVAAIGRVVTALFLRSYERGERVYLAMLARGYGGTMPRFAVLAFRRADTVFLAALAADAAPARGWWRHELRHPRPRPALPLPERRDAASTASTCTSRTASGWPCSGPNGAGKTTLMLHLNGLLTGEGDARGRRPARRRGRRARAARARSGSSSRIPTTSSSCPPSREDVAFGPLNLGRAAEEVRERVDSALGAVRMEHVADRAPHQLSLGQRRRVAIATVLAMRPRLLVLDEPSANLDPRARRELLEVLDRIDRTMLVVTHDLPFAAQLCERAVLLSGGPHRGRRPVYGAPRRTSELLADHDLELPAGFDLSRVALGV